MSNLANGPQIPLGLGMAMAEDLDAMNYFASLNAEQKRRIVEKTHQIQSKEDMRAFVHSMFLM